MQVSKCWRLGNERFVARSVKRWVVVFGGRLGGGGGGGGVAKGKLERTEKLQESKGCVSLAEGKYLITGSNSKKNSRGRE